jgi:hypothetical protein
MKKIIIVFALLVPYFLKGQNLPLSRDLQIEYQLQQKEQLPLSITAMSPWVLQVPDSIIKTPGTWLKRKLFNEHLLGVSEGDVWLTVDPLVNFQGGMDRISKKKTWTNTRGFIIKGKIGEQVTFESTFQENQASLTPYLDKFAHQYKIIPGSGRLHGYNGGTTFDYSMSTAYLDYTPNKHFDFQLGNGKHFIGEGYRSMFLSDESFSYPYLRITTSFWHIKYTNLYTQFQDLRKDITDTNYYRKKYSTMHLLSWDITKNFNFTFFEALVWNAGDSLAQRGFDVSYLNPVIFYRPVEFGLGSPDNALMGFMSSYRLNRTTIYGQLMLDEFRMKDVLKGNGMWGNKQSFQLGIKSYEPFNIKGLYVLAEYNHARPYTYAHSNVISNWGNYNQPLADPLGANFKEGVIQIRYQRDRWIGNITIVSAMYGLDMNNKNYGQNIFRSYNTIFQFYGNRTGQGLRTTLFYSESELRYVINKKMHLEAVGRMLYRNEKNNQWTQRDNEFTLGLRTNVFNRYGAF